MSRTHRRSEPTIGFRREFVAAHDYRIDSDPTPAHATRIDSTDTLASLVCAVTYGWLISRAARAHRAGDTETLAVIRTEFQRRRAVRS